MPLAVEERTELLDIATLLAKARQGDPDAFCRLVEPLQARLLRQALALCRNESVAEDLAAETLAEAWKSLRRYDGSSRLSTWLYAILLHRYQKQIRAARSRPIPLGWLPFVDAEKHSAAYQNEPSAESPPHGAVAQREFATEMKRVIDALPEKHRAVILLRFFEEASLDEMAGVLRCSMGTVKSRLHHALDKLRRMQITVNLFRAWRDTEI